VEVTAATGRIQGPVYIPDSTGKISCTYNLASTEGNVGLMFGAVNFKGTMNVSADGQVTSFPGR
jgi:hypothetical protein